MKKASIFLFFFLFVNITFGADVTDKDCTLFFSKVDRPSAKVQLEIYSKVGECSKYFEKNTALLKNVVNTYRLLFLVNRAHNHLEPFIPYYIQNKSVVDKLIQEVVVLKEEKADFFERLKIAQREFHDGNGE